MDKHIVVNLSYGIKKKEREREKIKLLIHQTIWMNPKCIMLNERNHSKGCILYGSIYKAFQNVRYKAIEHRGWDWVQWGSMRGWKNICISIAVVITQLYAFVKMHRTVQQKEWLLLYVNKENKSVTVMSWKVWRKVLKFPDLVAAFRINAHCLFLSVVTRKAEWIVLDSHHIFLQLMNTWPYFLVASQERSWLGTSSGFSYSDSPNSFPSAFPPFFSPQKECVTLAFLLGLILLI